MLHEKQIREEIEKEKMVNELKKNAPQTALDGGKVQFSPVQSVP